jgi:hypothetical protein
MVTSKATPRAAAALAVAVALGACGPTSIEVAAPPDGDAPDAGLLGIDGGDGGDGPEAGPPCRRGGTNALVPANVACGPGLPTRLAVDAVNLYWTDQRRGAVVLKAALASGAPEALVYDDEPAVGLAVDATNVYYTQPSRGRVMRVPIAGGPAVAVAAGLDSPTYLALGDAPDGPSLFWTGGQANGTGTITRLSLALGAKPETLIDGQAKPRALAVAGGFVFWTDLADGTVLRAPAQLDVTVGARVSVATRLAAGLKQPTDIALAGGFAYVPDQAHAIARVPLDGGALEKVSDVAGLPFGVATDGVSVYWTTLGDGGVFKAPLGSGVAATLIAGGERDARFLVVSSANVFWGAWGHGGAVRRMAK